jgi:DNA primase
MKDSAIEKIKEKIDVVDLVGGYIKLQKAGMNYRAHCPFHSEKTPSFFVFPARQNWHCFGCSLSGSIFDFVMKIEGIEFGDALKVLARRAGVELKKQDPRITTERQRLYEICEMSCCFFEKQLQSTKKGQEIENYLFKRGLNEESIKKWRIGYAPDMWQSLSDFLVSQGYSREEVVKAGMMAIKTTNNERQIASDKYYDRFRGRIIFPIFDLNSQVVGLGGRMLEGEKEGGVKYINTPNTLLYDKSRILYGLNFAKTEIRKKDFAILTEGYFDVILVHQAGFENALALSGTALSVEQMKTLKRYTPNLYTALDMDAAGDAATTKGIDLAQREDFNMKVISLPKGSDPADVAAKSAEEWRSLVENAQDIFDFYFQSAFSKFDQNKPEGKKEITNVLLLKIKEIPNKILQAHWIQQLANKIKIGEEIIWEELKKIIKREESKIIFSGAEMNKDEQAAIIKKIKTRKELLEERFLGLALKNSKNLEFSSSLFSPKINLILQIIKEQKEKEKIEKALKKLEKENKDIKQILNDAILTVEFDAKLKEKNTADEKHMADEIKICLKELKKIKTMSQLQNISEQIKIAEQKGEKQKVKELLKEFSETAKAKKKD